MPRNRFYVKLFRTESDLWVVPTMPSISKFFLKFDNQIGQEKTELKLKRICKELAELKNVSRALILL